MSRARLGLYVFCRKDLFKDCYELTQTFSKLLQRPDKLQLVKNESFGACVRTIDEQADENNVFQVEDVIHMGQIVTPAQQVAPPPEVLATPVDEDGGPIEDFGDSEGDAAAENEEGKNDVEMSEKNE
jgi:intron-binding protein aquarius